MANFALSELNLPPTNRFNVGFNFSRSRYLGDLNVTYSDSAFWQDVLDDRYHGTTKAYTQVNGGFAVKWAHNRLTTAVKGMNLANQDHPAARVRRHHQAPDRRGVTGQLLITCRGGSRAAHSRWRTVGGSRTAPTP